MDVVTDGAFEVDGGTAEEIRRELATETVDAHAHGTATAQPAADAVEEVDDDAEPVAEAPAKVGEVQKAQPKKKQTPAQRIGEMTAKMRGEERRRIAVERENADLKRRLEGGDGRRSGEESRSGGAATREGAQPAGEAAKFGGVPLTAEKYPSYAEMLQKNADLELEDYTDARQDWRSAKASVATQSEATTRAAHQDFEKVATAFADRMAPHLEADPKFYDTIDPELTETPAASIYPVGHPARKQFYPFVVDIIQRSETPKELLEWLSADGSKELQRLKTLRPEEVYKTLLRKELSIRPDGADSGPSSEELGGEAASNGGKPAQTSSQSAAAPPVKPVRGSSQQAVEIEATDDDSDDEWLRKEQARELAKVRRR